MYKNDREIPSELTHMANPRARAKQSDRCGTCGAVNNPLAFFVLNLLIIEAMLTVMLTISRLDEAHIWDGFLWMVGIFIGGVLIMAGLTILTPIKSWEAEIHDPTERRVFIVLDNGSTWRNTGGLARQTGLPEEKVSEIFGKYSDTFIRILEGASLTGSALAGLIESVG